MLHMHEYRLQIILAVLLLLILCRLLRAVLKKTLEIKYVLSWIIIDICLLIIDLFPPILSFLSELLGVQLPSNMIFLVAIILLFLLVFSHTVLLSRLMETNKTLIQEIALLKKELDEIKKQH